MFKEGQVYQYGSTTYGQIFYIHKVSRDRLELIRCWGGDRASDKYDMFNEPIESDFIKLLKLIN